MPSFRARSRASTSPSGSAPHRPGPASSWSPCRSAPSTRGGKDQQREGRGQVIAVYSPKGGVGKTTIAVNLACVLRRNGASVALFDGVMQFGAVRHLLPVPPATRSIVDLPPAPAMPPSPPEPTWEGPAAAPAPP